MPRPNRKIKSASVTSTGVAYKTQIIKQHTQIQLEKFKNEYATEAHLLTIQELEDRYETDIVKGLSQQEADTRLIKDGPNCLATPPQKSKLLLLMEFLFCGFQTLLWIAAIIDFIVYGITAYQTPNTPYDQLYFGSVVVLVIFFTGFFGFYQEAANVSIVESFKKLTPKTVTVIRNDQRAVIPSEEVVVGDLVELTAGEWIPADIRLVQVNGLKVDNSAITGESAPQSRTLQCTNQEAIETANMVFFSTSVVEGSGKGVVVLRGDDTLIGQIAGLASSLAKGETPIRKEINHFIKYITILSLTIGALYFIMCMASGYDFMTSFTYFIALVIANVPEGLPVTLTACMTLTCKRMASKNCLVKKLEAIETLGCCNVICSDKTGTLTQNKMTVAHIYYDAQAVPLTPFLDDEVETESKAYQALVRAAINCSRATFKSNQDSILPEHKEAIGDASEIAILKCMEMIEGHVEQKRLDFPKVCEIPFNSTNKYQLSIHRMNNSSFILLMKGAPERILDRCDTAIRFDKTEPFSAEIRKTVKKAMEHFGRHGERVLAFADLRLDPKTFTQDYVFDAEKTNFPMTGLRYVGLMSMIDPPRPSVPDAVAKCRTAGIRVIMVTGDHPLTAAAIARQVGIISRESITSYDIAITKEISRSLVTETDRHRCTAEVFTGADLREMSPNDLSECLMRYQEIVFARTSPQQKLKIVEAFQKLGNVVAVTGDGINDAPALKKADIGIAMGISGTDVSKEAADMILLDDNFSSIVTGIEEGRLIFDNLKKSIAYLLTSNMPEIVPFVIMALMDHPPMISVLAIMVIDVGTDLFPAISLAYEQAEADIMTRKPRDPLYDKLVNKRLIFLTYGNIGVIQTCACFASYYLVMFEYGFGWEKLFGLRADWTKDILIEDSFGIMWTEHERRILTQKSISGFFLSIVLTQIADLLICKTRKLSLYKQGMTNWVMNAGIFFEISIAVLVVYCPGIRTVLGFSPVGLSVLMPAVPFAFFIVVFDELRKLLIRRYPNGIVDQETYY